MKNINLANLSEEELLKLRICDLPLSLNGTWIEECIQQVYQDLDDKGLNFRPECYLAEEWLTPEDQPVIGIPFFLAHPSLVALEKKMMLEAEGERKDWCLKLLRHEVGHAISYAFRLNKKRKWRELFGSSSQEYSDTYRFRPYSKSYVRHLDGFYAQYHPDEDLAETFAVWLTPHSDWENKYKGWKAIRKLHYVDDLMKSIQGKEPLNKRGKKYWHCKTLRITLQNFYKKRRKLHVEDFPDFHDGNLRRIFIYDENSKHPSLWASDILQQHRKNIINEVAKWTGEKKYVVNDLLKTMNKRCRQLKLKTHEAESTIILKITAYITTLIMNYSYTGWYRGNKKLKKLSKVE